MAQMMTTGGHLRAEILSAGDSRTTSWGQRVSGVTLTITVKMHAIRAIGTFIRMFGDTETPAATERREITQVSMITD
ncbi:unnamed protein product, partial [Mesorhabditis belari]|uniref:Uncharacterized protein n=1 Tax=Mesorhabditis belari TaxID=2138241 RepID=A0AAF3J775_9BILA